MTKRAKHLLATGAAAALIVVGTAAVAVFVPAPAVPGVPLAALPTVTSSDELAPPPAEQETVVVKAKDGNSELTVPASWSKPPKAYLNPEAEIQLGNDFTGEYIMVITDDKRDFASFTDYSEALIQNSRDLSSKFKSRGKTNLTIGGLPAVRHNYSATVEGLNAIFWHTAVDGDRDYHQVVGWTVVSMEDTAKPAILKAIDSFREIRKT